jgi:hypothetical protein
MLIRTKLSINITSVDISARQRYRIILFGNLYAGERGGGRDFRRSMGRLEEYDPDVSREEMAEEE